MKKEIIIKPGPKNRLPIELVLALMSKGSIEPLKRGKGSYNRKKEKKIDQGDID